MTGPVVSSRVPAAPPVEATITAAVWGRGVDAWAGTSGTAALSTGSDVRPRASESRVQWPRLPPVLSSSWMSVSRAAGSTAFTMSWRVSPAMATAVRASISTPVCPVVLAVAVIPMESTPNSKSIFTELNGIWWHSGISSLVFFAPEIPAMRAVARTSALGRLSARTRVMTSARVTRRPVAMAVRAVTAFAPTSTIRARPSESRWVRTSVEVSEVTGLAESAGPAESAGRAESTGRPESTDSGVFSVTVAQSPRGRPRLGGWCRRECRAERPRQRGPPRGVIPVRR